MNADTVSDSPAAFESAGEGSETLGDCTTPEVSAGEGCGPAKRKRARAKLNASACPVEARQQRESNAENLGQCASTALEPAVFVVRLVRLAISAGF